METVLITGARAPIALEMARSFKKAGHRVIMADVLRLTIARWSNTVDRYIVFPSPKFNPNAFVEKIKNIINDEKITQIIPTCEEAFYFSMYRNEFDCKVWVSDFELMNELHSKLNFIEMGTKFFNVPKTIHLGKFDDWQSSKYYVFKPIFSRFATSVIINQQIDKNTIPKNQQENWIAQQKIEGKEICIYSIWDNGKMKAFVMYHPLYRVGKGAGIFFEPVDNDCIKERVKNFGEGINYTGQLCFDVIIDKLDIPYFIECNPRATSGGHLLNERLSKAFLDDVFETQTIQDFSIKYALALLHPMQFFSEKIRLSKDVIFQKNDILPSFLQFLSILEILYIKFKQGVSWLEATTGDIEWNGK